MRFHHAICLLTLFIATEATLLGKLYSAVAAPSPHVPAQVELNARIAQERMQRVNIGFNLYANAFPDPLPPQLHLLFPTYVNDPLAFWHPGDADLAPVTIDNSIPNAPNSALISFDFDAATVADPCRPFYVRDNSAGNNAGLFVIELREDGFRTVPPLPALMPGPSLFARRHLVNLAHSLLIYANDNRQRLPDTAPATPTAIHVLISAT